MIIWAMAIKEALRRLVRARGYDISSFPGGSERLDAHLIQLFRLLQINHVLDVGANVGHYGDFLRKQVNFKGAIDAFEPVTECAAVLRQRSAGDRLWRTHELALGDTEEQKLLNVTRNTLFSSFLTPGTRSQKRFGTAAAVRDRVTVNVRRLDRVLPDLVDLSPTTRIFLKLDTQGFDLQVVAGAEGIWNDILAIQIELSVRPLYQGMTDYLEALAQLQELGLEVTGLFPVTRDPALRVIEYDAVLVNPAAIGARFRTEES